jgi:hypothetical protein
MSSNERAATLVRGVIAANLRSAPHQHPQRTDSCLSLAVLAEIAEQEIGSELAVHAAGCGHCRTTLRAALADDGWTRNEWACAEAAVQAHANQEHSSLIESFALRGAHALLAARDELARHPLTEDVRDALVDLATGLAEVLWDCVNQVATMLLAAAYELRIASATAPQRGASDVPMTLSSYVLEWATERDARGALKDLRVARELYLTIGDRARAASCSSRAASLLYPASSDGDARVEFARAALDTDDDGMLADALAGVGRTSVRLGDSELATASLAAAEQIYRALGDRPRADSLLAERVSSVTRGKRIQARRSAQTRQAGNQ